MYSISYISTRLTTEFTQQSTKNQDVEILTVILSLSLLFTTFNISILFVVRFIFKKKYNYIACMLIMQFTIFVCHGGAVRWWYISLKITVKFHTYWSSLVIISCTTTRVVLYHNMLSLSSSIFPLGKIYKKKRERATVPIYFSFYSSFALARSPYIRHVVCFHVVQVHLDMMTWRRWWKWWYGSDGKKMYLSW